MNTGRKDGGRCRVVTANGERLKPLARNVGG
jgi:hypothetical protein